MSLLTLIALRSVTKRPARTILSMLGIAVGIATVVALITVDHDTTLWFSRPGERDWVADVEVSPNDARTDPRRDLEGIAGVEQVAAFFQQEVDLTAGGEPLRVRLYALEARRARPFDAYRVSAGEDLAGAGIERPALVGEKLAGDLGLDVGARVLLARPPRSPKKICIEGRIREVDVDEPLPPRSREFTVVGLLADERLGARVSNRMVVVDYTDGVELFEDAHVSQSFVVSKNPDADLEAMKASLGFVGSFEMNSKVIVGKAADEKAFRTGVQIAGFLALLLGLFVIFHTLSVSLLERMREVATLHALGATRGQIARVFFGEACLLAFGGGALGLGGGLALARLLLREGVTTLGVGKHVPVFEVPWSDVVPLVVLGGMCALLGSVYPLLRLGRADAVHSLRGDVELRGADVARGFRVFSVLVLVLVLPLLYLSLVPSVGVLKGEVVGVLILSGVVLALLVGLPMIVPEVVGRVVSRLLGPLRARLPFAGLMCARTIEERPARIASAIVVLAMVAAAFTALRGMTRSLVAEVEVWGATAVERKVFVSGLDDVAYAPLRDALLAVDGVLAVESGAARTHSPMLLVGLEAEQVARYGPLADAEVLRSFREDRGIVVSGRQANDLGYTVGDTVNVRTGRGKVEEFTVVAVSDEYGYFPWPDERLYGVIDSQVMRRDFCVGLKHADRLAIRLEDGADAGDVERRIRPVLAELAPDAGTETGREVVGRAIRDIERDFLLFDVIITLTAILAMMGILNGQLLSALERTKELGILRALGADGRQITTTVMVEALVVGVTGGAIGVVLGAVMTPAIVEALQSISALALPHRGAGIFGLIAFVAAVLLSLTAAVYPAWRMRRMSPVRAIRTGG